MKRLLRLIMLLLVRVIGVFAAIKASRQAKRTASEAPRILLIRPDHLGDLVLTTPVLEALRAESIRSLDSSVTMAASPQMPEPPIV